MWLLVMIVTVALGAFSFVAGGRYVVESDDPASQWRIILGHSIGVGAAALVLGLGLAVTSARAQPPQPAPAKAAAAGCPGDASWSGPLPAGKRCPLSGAPIRRRHCDVRIPDRVPNGAWVMLPGPTICNPEEWIPLNRDRS